MGVVVRRYIDILTIIINFPYSTCISSFFGSNIPTSLFIFLKCFFGLVRIRIRIRSRNGDFFFRATRTNLRYYGDVAHSFYWKSAVEDDGGV